MCLVLPSVLLNQEADNIKPELEEIDHIDLPEQEEAIEEESLTAQDLTGRIIRDIIVTGNTSVNNAAVLTKLPYRKGQTFDPIRSREAIRNLYYDLKRFRNITIMAEPIDENTIDLHIIVEEKIPVIQISFEGNSALSEKDLKEKIPQLDTPAIDPEELKSFANAIKKQYIERGYYSTSVEPELTLDDAGKAVIVFHIDEKCKSLVKRIDFKGNKNISGKTLRSIIYTREDWLLSFMDKSGTFLPDRLEADKHAIEMYYQSKGYMNAKVAAVHTNMDPCTNDFNLIFEIQEGDLYTINCVNAPGNDLLNESELLKVIPIKPCDLYSRERLVDAIKNLELLWGNFGYLYAHIEPSIEPNDENKTVDISFRSELGNQITLENLTIRGNKKTRDKIIRRQILFGEGDLLTNTRMEQSKERIQALGYFDQRDGVNWRIIRTSDTTADVDLLLKEAKTGHLGFQLGFAGDPDSIVEPLKGMSLQLDVGDSNLFGSGISTNLMTKFSHEDFILNFNLTQPWLFDRPIFGAIDVFHKRVAYEDLNYVAAPVNEIDTGMLLTGGFMTNWYNNFLRDTLIRGALGFDNIRYQPLPVASIQELREPDKTIAQNQYNLILRKMFNPGNYGSFSFNMGQEKRNHPIHPSNGYSWLARASITFNFSQSCLGFHKYDFDAHYFTPLIGAYDLIFHLRGYIGFLFPFKNRLVPYRELFHIGGPASVRGFLFGEIGPQFNVNDPLSGPTRGDSIGGSKATWINAELIFPITNDMNFKGVLFYDGGAGWDNPYADCVDRRYIRNNHFNYRHAVGFGIRIYNPMPLRVDWGFKLDPRKGEPAYEVHFNTSYDW